MRYKKSKPQIGRVIISAEMARKLNEMIVAALWWDKCRAAAMSGKSADWIGAADKMKRALHIVQSHKD